MEKQDRSKSILSEKLNANEVDEVEEEKENNASEEKCEVKIRGKNFHGVLRNYNFYTDEYPLLYFAYQFVLTMSITEVSK